MTHLFHGSVMFALSQWLVLVLLATFGGDEESGKYVFALATTAPIFMLFDLNLRVTRSTDHQHGERFRNYLAIRLICLLAAVAVTLTITTVFFSNRLWVFVGVMLYRVGDSLSNLSFGGFQRMQQSDLIGKSLTPKGITAIMAIALVCWLSGGSAIAAAFVMAAISISWAMVRDLPRSWKLNESDQSITLACIAKAIADRDSNIRIAKRALPLGFDSFVSSLALNSPRYCIEYWLGTAALGVYGLLSQLAFSIQMLIGAVGHTGVSILSEAFRDGESERFWRLFNKMLLSSISVGILAIVTGTIVIPPVISYFLSESYNRPLLVFLLLMASCLAGAQRTAGRATQACGSYVWYTIFDVIIFAGSLTTALLIVKTHGLVGGALAVVVGFGLGLAVTLLHTYGLLWRGSQTNGTEAVTSSQTSR